MRSPRDTMLVARGRDPRDVGFHDRKIDAERRRVELALWQSDDTESNEQHALPPDPHDSK
jgi:hypothetical protein